ncbi:MAG: MarR family transcriptional regulator [Candidatus Caenarcaniphilales bacterium]|nr:MarR family transcriptional regulator [Candidatus Caenarcaniphilales bacterium]
MKNRALTLFGHIETMMDNFIDIQQQQGGEIDCLSKPEFRLLKVLIDSGDCTMSELATKARFVLSTSTVTVDKLVSKKLVQRQRPEADRRTVVVKITAEGRDAYKKQLDRLIELSTGMLESLSEEEQILFLQFFAKIGNYFASKNALMASKN